MSAVQCVVTKNIHTHLIAGQWKFQEDRRAQKPKNFKESMKLNWDFWRDGVQTKKPLMERVSIFSRQTQSSNIFLLFKYCYIIFSSAMNLNPHDFFDPVCKMSLIFFGCCVRFYMQAKHRI